MRLPLFLFLFLKTPKRLVACGVQCYEQTSFLSGIKTTIYIIYLDFQPQKGLLHVEFNVMPEIKKYVRNYVMHQFCQNLKLSLYLF